MGESSGPGLEGRDLASSYGNHYLIVLDSRVVRAIRWTMSSRLEPQTWQIVVYRPIYWSDPPRITSIIETLEYLLRERFKSVASNEGPIRRLLFSIFGI